MPVLQQYPDEVKAIVGDQPRELVPALPFAPGLLEDGQYLCGPPVAFCWIPVVHGQFFLQPLCIDVGVAGTFFLRPRGDVG